jgi:hypothetical protein
MNNDELLYKQKYLKYKFKYLELKKMYGGAMLALPVAKSALKLAAPNINGSVNNAVNKTVDTVKKACIEKVEEAYGKCKQNTFCKIGADKAHEFGLKTCETVTQTANEAAKNLIKKI